MAQEQVDKTDTKKELLKLIQDISCLEKLNAWTHCCPVKVPDDYYNV